MPAQRLVDRHSLNILKMDNSSASGLPPNNSNQKLVAEDYLENSNGNGNGIMHSISSGDLVDSSEIGINHHGSSGRQKLSKYEIVTVAILCFVNLINYMDRFTVAAILDSIKSHYGNISNTKAGLLQTAFVVSYMIFAPLFGYLGDRYSRKYLMAAGVFLWCITTLIGSFMPTFEWFLAFRALVGIGEASYSTIAPTIISDMFVDDRRSKMLAFFYFAIPVGSGLGYITGSGVASLAGQWQWGLRVTPIMGAVAVLLILFVMTEPARGESEHSQLQPTSYKEDVIYLLKNPSFMLSTLGFTCVAFVTGALAWWGPTFITKGLQLQEGTGAKTSQETCAADEVCSEEEPWVALVFGAITVASGVVGVIGGTLISAKLKKRFPRIDPLICACGLLGSVPFLVLALYLTRHTIAASFVLMFFGVLLLNLNWAVVADILLYVVIPTRRSTAEAFQILLSHALGDAGSPYLIGQVSDWLEPVLNSTYEHYDNSTQLQVEFSSLQYSLFITSFIEVLGGLFFLICAWYIIEDKFRADKAIVGDELMNEGSEPTHYDADRPPSLN